MFLGTYEPKLDDKGRMFLPARFREDMEGGIVLTRGQEHCIYAFPASEFENMTAELRRAPLSSKQARDWIRVMLSGAYKEIPDKQGRISVPADLRAYAGLGRELAVIGAGGLGNGWLLPAGPLREPVSRLDKVDALILNTTTDVEVESRTPRFAVSSCFGACRRLSNGDIRDIDEISHDLKASQGKALAAAGIASPGRFFAMVRAHDIDCAELELGDHYDFAKNPFAGRKESIILITAKDAVKCARIPEIKNDDRIWVIGLEVVLDAYLVDIVDQKAAAAAQRMGRHPETRNDKIE